MITKIRIPAVTLEVDINGWALEYGIDATAADVREDVKRYFDLSNCLPEHLIEIVKVL